MENKDSTKKVFGLAIRIGGISLLLKGKTSQNKGFKDPCYTKFLSHESSRTSLIFKQSNERLPDKIYRHRFDSPGLWSIDFNDNSDFRIELKGRGKRPLAYVEVSVKGKKGFIYTNNKGLEGRMSEFFAQRLFSLPFSYPVDEVIFMNILPLYKGLLLHACGIDDNGKGYIFSGFSGAGKSTMARQWLRKRGVRLLNDDRVIVREMRRNFYIFGTPWHGEINKCDPGMVRLKTIFLIKHGSENKARPLSPSEAVTSLIARSFSPLWDREGMERAMEVIERLVRKVPCYELSFKPDKGVINYIRSVDL